MALLLASYAKEFRRHAGDIRSEELAEDRFDRSTLVRFTGGAVQVESRRTLAEEREPE
jgi:hypothetical protein